MEGYGRIFLPRYVHHQKTISFGSNWDVGGKKKDGSSQTKRKKPAWYGMDLQVLIVGLRGNMRQEEGRDGGMSE